MAELSTEMSSPKETVATSTSITSKGGKITVKPLVNPRKFLFLPFRMKTPSNERFLWKWIEMLMEFCTFLLSILPSFLSSFLPLGARAQGELWPPEKSASILFYNPSEADYLVSERFSFYGVRLTSRPTPNLEDQGISLPLAPTP
jgi:hypothetical protein